MRATIRRDEIDAIIADLRDVGNVPDVLDRLVLRVDALQRTAASRRPARTQIDRGGRLRFGYQRSRTGIVINPSQATQVLQILDLWEAKHSLHAIAAYMQAHYPRPNGRRWYASTIRCIVQQKAIYAGGPRSAGGNWPTIWMPPAEREKALLVDLNLRVENNNKYIRGKARVRQEIETYVLSRHDMRKLQQDGWDYHLTLRYHTEAELAEMITDLYRDMTDYADRRYCFIEADIMALDGSERSW